MSATRLFSLSELRADQGPTVRPRTCSLIVQPGDSFFPIEDAIDFAEQSISATVYKMDCPVIRKAILRAAARGVRVRIILSSRVKDDFHANRELREELTAGGVEVEFPRGALGKLERYHAKILLVDGRQAFVFTFNPTQANLHAYRDFGVKLEDQNLVRALEETFEGDWVGEERSVSAPGLAISPGRSREPINRLLSGAERRIWVYDAKIKDPVILQTLAQKAQNGVDVRIITRGTQREKLPPEVRAHTIERIHLHARVALVDDRYFFLGSQNLRELYLDERREVGVLIESEPLVAELEGIFLSDWGEEQQIETATVSVPVMEGSGEMCVLMSRRHSKLHFPLQKGINTIGRAKDSMLQLSHVSVSRRHAELIFNRQGFRLRDFSRVGTWVNGERVECEREIQPGDLIRFGSWEEFRLLWI